MIRSSAPQQTLLLILLWWWWFFYTFGSHRCTRRGRYFKCPIVCNDGWNQFQTDSLFSKIFLFKLMGHILNQLVPLISLGKCVPMSKKKKLSIGQTTSNEIKGKKLSLFLSYNTIMFRCCCWIGYKDFIGTIARPFDILGSSSAIHVTFSVSLLNFRFVKCFFSFLFIL